MSLIKLFSAVALASVSASALADYSITGITGYQFTPDNAHKHQTLDVGGSAKDTGVFGVSVNKSVTDRLSGSVEWNTTRANGNGEAKDMFTHSYFMNARYNVLQKYNVTAMGGVGFAQTTTKYHDRAATTQDSPVLQVGLGHKHDFTNNIGVRTEGRAVYNTNNNYWNPQILVGLEYTFK